LNYPECAREFKAMLCEDLQTLGKALARRDTYKQIADAAFRCPSLKTYLMMRMNRILLIITAHS